MSQTIQSMDDDEGRLRLVLRSSSRVAVLAIYRGLFPFVSFLAAQI